MTKSRDAADKAPLAATLAGTETLTNKTLVSPIITSPQAITDPFVVSLNSSSDALRITQTGTGNALVVEDSANPDATPFVIDASGAVIAGSTTALSTANDNGGVVAKISASGSTVASFAALGANSTTARYTSSLALKRTRGTEAAPTSVVSGDYLGRLDFQGHDGTSFVDAALIYAAVDGTPGTNDMPGRLVFSTTPDGASSPTERMRIDSGGNVGIGLIPNYLLDLYKIAGTVLRVRNSPATGASPSTTHGEFVIESTETNMGMQFLGVTTSNQKILFSDTAASSGQITYDHTSDYMAFSVNGSERLRIDSAGNVGIGTSSPTEKLHVLSTDNTNTYIRAVVQNTSTITGNGVGAELEVRADAGHVSFGMYGSNHTGTIFGLPQANTAAFFTKSSFPASRFVMGTRTNIPYHVATNDTVRLTIDGSGNVGIGTASPAYTLDVNGSLNASSLYISGSAVATTAFVQTAVANLVDTAPSTLDTLNELAAALGDDANFATTVTNSIATKVSKSGDTMTGDLTISKPGSPTLGVLSTTGSGADALVKIGGARTASSSSNISMVQFRNETSSPYTLAEISAQDPSASHTLGNGRLIFRTSNSGTLTDKLVIPNTGSPTYEGNTLWHAGNDGTGSGLDADLLDGEHGSYYTDIVSRLGYTPVNKAGDIITGDLEIRNLNDASQLRISRTGATSNQVGMSFNVEGVHERWFGVGTTGNPYWSTSADLTGGGNVIWHAGNDGTGSGLDADLLDGIDSSSFLRSDVDGSFTGTITNNGVLVASLNSNLPTTNPRIKFGRDASQYMTFHAGSAGNYMTSVSTSSNPKPMMYFGISTDSGATLIGTYTLGGTNGNIWHTGNDGAGTGLDADLWDGNQFDSYLNQAVLTSSSPTFVDLTTTGDITVGGGNIKTDTSSQRVKYSVYSDQVTYGMGFQSGVTYGGLNDWAVTFQNSNTNTRGFWWGDNAHAPSQGAMALSTSGLLTVASGIRVGYGESDTTIPTANKVDISGSLVATGGITETRINPRVFTTTSVASITPDISSYDQYCLTAQAAALTINAPIGTPADGNRLLFRILDNNTSRAITWNAIFTPIGVSLPAVTTTGKRTYVGAIYNAANVTWDVIAVTTQI